MEAQTSQIATRYLELFFADIEQFNDFTATYKTVLMEGKVMMGKMNPSVEEMVDYVKKLDAKEKNKIWYQAQYVRYLVTRIDLKFTALKDKIKEFEEIDEKVLANYREKIRETPIPDFSDVNGFAHEVNKILVTGMVAKFLEGNAAGYGSLLSNDYNQEQKGPNGNEQ